MCVCVCVWSGGGGGWRIQIPLLTDLQRPASETPYKLRFAGGPMMAWFFRGSGQALVRNPIFSWFFRGGSRPSVPLPPPLNPHMQNIDFKAVERLHKISGRSAATKQLKSFFLYILPDPLSSIIGRCTLYTPGCRMKAYK